MYIPITLGIYRYNVYSYWGYYQETFFSHISDNESDDSGQPPLDPCSPDTNGYVTWRC